MRLRQSRHRAILISHSAATLARTHVTQSLTPMTYSFPALLSRSILLGLCIAAVAVPVRADEKPADTSAETASEPAPVQRRAAGPASQMALKVGEYTDNVWEIVPDNGTANVRLEPFA